MKLIGSGTSPFVRRIRLLLGERDYEFARLDIYGKDRDELRRQNPALKIPMLLDGERSIYDSRVIARYLADKFGHAPLSWAQENQQTLADAASDSMVILAQSKRSGLEVSEDIMFYKLQHERIRMSMQALCDLAGEGAFDDWHYPAICVYCLVDWADVRDLFDFDGFQPLLAIRERHRNQAMVEQTDPRKAI